MIVKSHKTVKNIFINMEKIKMCQFEMGADLCQHKYEPLSFVTNVPILFFIFLFVFKFKIVKWSLKISSYILNYRVKYIHSK